MRRRLEVLLLIALAAAASVVGTSVLPLGEPSDSGGRLAADATPALEVNASAATGYPNCDTGEVNLTFWANVTGGQAPYNAVWTFPDGAHANGLVVTHHFSTWIQGNLASVVVTDAANHVAQGTAILRLLYPPCAAVEERGPGINTLTVIAGGTVAVVALVGVAALVRARRRAGRPPTPPAP